MNCNLTDHDRDNGRFCRSFNCSNCRGYKIRPVAAAPLQFQDTENNLDGAKRAVKKSRLLLDMYTTINYCEEHQETEPNEHIALFHKYKIRIQDLL